MTITIGKHTYGSPIVNTWGDKSVNLTIGKFCSIASNLQIYLSGNHRTDIITTYPFHFMFDWAENIDTLPRSNGDVNIGNDVWIGNDVLILSGVTIGDGAVIGAKSVVTKDVLPYSIVAGNPASFKYFRFTEKEIVDLLEIRWYDWDEEEIKEHVEVICSKDINKLLGIHKRRLNK